MQGEFFDFPQEDFLHFADGNAFDYGLLFVWHVGQVSVGFDEFFGFSKRPQRVAGRKYVIRPVFCAVGNYFPDGSSEAFKRRQEKSSCRNGLKPLTLQCS